MKLFVLAGNYDEFKFNFPKPDPDVIYICSGKELLGWHGGKVVRVGTWYERPDIEKLERAVASVELK